MRVVMPIPRSVLQSALLVSVLLFPAAITAQSATTVMGTATLTVEQTGPEDKVAGEWSLMKPDFKRADMGKKIAHTFLSAMAGNYTIIATPPSGASSVVELWINGELKKTVDFAQISFILAENDSARVLVTYTYTRTGKISVTTEPQGLSFRIKGPNNLTFSGSSPKEFLNVPEGQYTLTFDPITDCVSPKPKSDRLLKGGRITFSITIVCAKLDLLPQSRERENALQYVTVSVHGERVTFEDVETDAWYATSVHAAIRTGIMSGYKDTDGKPTGRFGPGDSVTLAQLAKVAHRIAGIDESKNRSLPENLRAHGTWFAQVYASAERQHWLAFRNVREDPERSATRAEVVCTLLQALDIPLLWSKGERFTDVTPRTPYADCIETAAKDTLIGGDGTGGTFGPDRPINRAELSKIITTAIQIYGEKTLEIRGNYDGGN